jgi:hypothetical protein
VIKTNILGGNEVECWQKRLKHLAIKAVRIRQLYSTVSRKYRSGIGLSGRFESQNTWTMYQRIAVKEALQIVWKSEIAAYSFWRKKYQICGSGRAWGAAHNDASCRHE